MNSKEKKSTNFKLITQISDSLSYQSLIGCMPPQNTPLSPDFKSPWKNIIIEDNIQFVWNQNDEVISNEPKAFEINKQDLKDQMKSLDKTKFSHLQHLIQRHCVEQLKYTEIWNLNKPKYEQQPIQHDSIEHITLTRQFVDPKIQKRKEQMSDNFKWLDVQKKYTDPKITLIKEIKFRLNQLAPQNYNQVSKIILDQTKTRYFFVLQQILSDIDLILEAIIEKGIYEDKYRNLYAQLIDDWMKIMSNDDVQLLKINIKKRLLKNLQYTEYNEIFDKYIELDEGEILIQETKRKKILTGNAKFVGELTCWYILEIEFINDIIREIFTRYINEYRKLENTNSEKLKKHNEENIEIFMTLLDSCGHIYCVDDSMSVFEYDLIDSLKNKVKIFQSVRLSKDGAKQVIDIILNTYTLSKRIYILLGNLKEIIIQGWKNKVKTQKIQSFSEDEDGEDYPV